MGKAAFSISFAAYFSLFSGLGVSVYGVREASKFSNEPENRAKLLIELFVIVLCSSFLTSLVYYTVVFLSNGLIGIRNHLFIAGIQVLIHSTSVDWYLQSQKEFKILATRALVIKMLVLVFSFFLVKDDALMYVCITIGSVVLMNLWNVLYILRREQFALPERLEIKKHLKPLFVFLAMALAVSIYTTMDTIMLGIMKDFNEVGIYTSATRITKILLPFAIITSTVVLPDLSKLSYENETIALQEKLQYSFKATLAIVTPLTIGLMLMSNKIVLFLYGIEYIESSLVLTILSPVLLIVGVSNFFGIQIISNLGREKLLMTIIFIGAILNFSLNFIFIHNYGYVATSVSSVIAELLILLLTITYSKRIIKLAVLPKYVVMPLLGSLPFTLIHLIMIDLHHWIFIFIEILLSSVCYIIFMRKYLKNERLWI